MHHPGAFVPRERGGVAAVDVISGAMRKHRTRNLEIPGSRFACQGMTSKKYQP